MLHGLGAPKPGSRCWEDYSTPDADRGRNESAPNLAESSARREGGFAAMSDSNEVLVVSSKVKRYIKERGEMKTSSSVLQALSDKLRAMCDAAVESARADGRKTVLDRDFN